MIATSLIPFSTVVLGRHFTLQICEGLKSERDAKILKARLSRDLAYASKVIVIVEASAPLQPNLIDGVQKGWFAEDSTFNVAVLDRPHDSCDYALLAFALGFNPQNEGSHEVNFLEKWAVLLSQLPSKSKLSLSSVSKNCATMIVEMGQVLTSQDVQMATNFNEEAFLVRYRDVSKNDYHQTFLSNGLIVFGTCF